MLRCTQGILSSRLDHKCDRVADFVLLYPQQHLPRCQTHMLQMLSIASVGVMVMNIPTYQKFMGAKDKEN